MYYHSQRVIVSAQSCYDKATERESPLAVENPNIYLRLHIARLSDDRRRNIRPNYRGNRRKFTHEITHVNK